MTAFFWVTFLGSRLVFRCRLRSLLLHAVRDVLLRRQLSAAVFV